MLARKIGRLLVKIGDLVKLDKIAYPQYRGKLGIIHSEWEFNHFADVQVTGPEDLKWAVMIDGRIHPYTINGKYIEVINENR